MKSRNYPVSLFLADEIDKQKRELLSARQAKEAAEHQCITEVFKRKVFFFSCLVTRKVVTSNKFIGCPFYGMARLFSQEFFFTDSLLV